MTLWLCRTATVFRLSKNNFLDSFSFIANGKLNFLSFFYIKQTFLVPKLIISTGARFSENWQSATDNWKWSSLVSELKTFIHGILSKLLFQWVRWKKSSICINFLFEVKWRSTTWFTAFWNLHIFVTFAEFAVWENERRKVNILIFMIWNVHATPPPLTHQQLKYHQRTKISKTILSAFLSLVFHTKFTISELKNK